MKRTERTVFISYRRTNAPWALAIYQYLHHNGFDVFFDYISIPSGEFESVIMESIKARAHFIILLTPSALERCNEPNDWLRKEIEVAIDHKRNIVPIMLEGFDFGMPAIAKHLTGKLALIPRYNGMTVPVEYFDAAMTKLRDQFLSVSLDAVIHPVSSSTEESVRTQQTAAETAPPVTEQALTAQQWFEKGYLSNDPIEQIRCYTNAVQIEPDAAGAYNNRCLAYSKMEDYPAALADINRAIELRPDYTDAYFNRGSTYYRMGDHPAALADFNRAIELQPDHADSYFNRGNAYSNLENYKAALADFNRALELRPDYADTVYNIACAHALLQQVESACIWLHRAIQLDQKCLEDGRTDPDFDLIRDTPEFQAVLKEFGIS